VAVGISSDADQCRPRSERNGVITFTNQSSSEPSKKQPEKSA